MSSSIPSTTALEAAGLPCRHVLENCLVTCSDEGYSSGCGGSVKSRNSILSNASSLSAGSCTTISEDSTSNSNKKQSKSSSSSSSKKQSNNNSSNGNSDRCCMCAVERRAAAEAASQSWLRKQSRRDRRAAFAQAMALRQNGEVVARHLTVVVNPVSGAGKARRTLEKTVLPMLVLAGVAVDVRTTQRRGHAAEMLRTIDPAATDGVLVLGGDGLVHEAVTGLMQHPDPLARAAISLGIIPSGTANAMAHELDGYESKTATALIGRVVLAACRKTSLRVDAIGCHFPDETGAFPSAASTSASTSTSASDSSAPSHSPSPLGSSTSLSSISTNDNNNSSSSEITPTNAAPTPTTSTTESSQYALSVFGWGMGGAVAKVADQLRWLPGQKAIRYDLASFVSVVKDWPPRCPSTISYPVPGSTTGEWASEQISIANLIATKLPCLGADHKIVREVHSGHMAVTWMETSISRLDLVKAGLAMKRGEYLGEQPKSRNLQLREFYLFPGTTAAPSASSSTSAATPAAADMLIDGDPMLARPVHVVAHPAAIALFTASSQASAASML